MSSAADAVTTALATALEAFDPNAPLVIALSGGLDSCVLLHAITMLGLPSIRPCAIKHVNHHLHSKASAWADFCMHLAANYRLSFELLHVNLSANEGQSLEALAREQRYRALLPKSDGELVLTAHHADDQAETFLLQALRGAGPKGLSSMPMSKPFGRGQLVRPLLSLTQQTLRAYAKDYALDWVEDPSNEVLTFTRNKLRHQVFPVIQEHFPHAVETLSRSARHCASGGVVEKLLLEEKLVTLWDKNDETLALTQFRQADALVQAALLRHWLNDFVTQLPTEKKLNDILSSVVNAKGDATPSVYFSDVVVTRYRDKLYCLREEVFSRKGQDCTWTCEQPLMLPELKRTLMMQEKVGEGVSREKVSTLPFIKVVFAPQGVAIKLAGESFHRKLSHCWQRFAIPFWRRAQTPVLMTPEGEVIAIVGVVIAADWQADATKQGLVPVLEKCF